MLCSKCHSDQVIPNVRIVDRGHLGGDLTAEIYEYPDAFVFKGGFSETSLRVHLCGHCGFCELYAAAPAAMWQAFQAFSGGSGTRRSDLPVVDGVEAEGVNAIPNKPA